MNAELKPNTPITQGNVGLLKAGDWIDHPEWGLAQYQPLSEDDNSLTGPWTYIGPDLGDGWIGWGGGENPVPGTWVQVRFRDGSEGEYSSGAWTASWHDGQRETDIIAFRPALAKPAEGEVVVERVRSWSQPGPEWLQSKEHTYNTLPEWSRQIPSTPTPPSVDWSVVGPKLVEAVKELRALIDEVAPEYSESTVSANADAALTAAQPEDRT